MRELPVLIVLFIVGASAAEPPPLPESMRPEAFVNGVALSPDGRLVASGGDDGLIRVFDAQTGEIRAQMFPSREEHERSRKLRPGRGTGVYTYTLDDVSAVLFTPDGRQLISGGNDEMVRVWDVPTGALVRSLWWGDYALDHFDGGIECLALSTDGTRVAAGGWDGTLRLWSLASGAQERTFAGHRGPVRAVAFSPDGTLLATASNDGTARVWDVATGAVRHVLKGHGAVVTAIAFSPDGRALATGADGLTTFNSDIGTKTQVDDQDLVQPAPGVRMFFLWDVASGRPIVSDSFGIDHVTSLAYAPDGRHLYAAIFDNGKGHAILRIDVRSRTVVGRFLSGPGNVATLAVSTDGGRVVANDKAEVVLLDAISGHLLRRF